MIQTNFSKVRVIISKNSSGKYTDKIDCTDFRFTVNNNQSFYCLDKEDKKTSTGLYDNVCYGSALTMNNKSWAKASLDLTNSPFKVGSAF